MPQIFANFVDRAGQHGPGDIQHKRVSFLGTGGAQQVAVVWDVPFADANYTVQYAIELDSGNEVTDNGLTAKTATGFSVNVTGIASQQFVLHAVAFHD
jgi:hypothetical protein